MIIRNFRVVGQHKLEKAHGGKGLVKNVQIFTHKDFDTKLQFIIYTELEPGCSIGYHKHGEDEEIYLILEGQGTMNVNGESKIVNIGDVILNKPNSSHGLDNTSQNLLKLFVFKVNR